MVNALIQIDAETNRILNTVKAANGLRDKGAAVEYLAKEYASCPECAGRQFKPEFLKRIREAAARMDRGEGILINDWDKHFNVSKNSRTKSGKTVPKTRKEGSRSA